MKIFRKIFIPALIFSALVLPNSCKEEKLELTNPNQLSPETYFKTAAQVQSAVNAAYGSLQTTSLYNRHIWFGYDNMSHENSGNSQLEADKRQYLNFTFDASHGAIDGFWATCFRGINKANFVINNEEVINSQIPDAQLSAALKTKYVGEAKFLRALYYFMLVTQYGDVPLYLDVPVDGQGLARSPKADIWGQIEADLTDAANRLLLRSEDETGRATKDAAWALLGKARLFQEKYQEALDAFNHVAGYSLEPVYFNNFMEETENGPESIFEVQFSVDAGTANRWDSDRSDQGLNEATFRGQEYGWANWFNVYPSLDLWNEFETAADNGTKLDPRRGYCIYANGDTYAGGVVSIPDDIVQDAQGNVIETIVRRGWRKYQNYYKDATEGAVVGQASGINMKVIRYADVILMKAECEANRPGGDLAAAVALMNQVRQRPDVDMPLYGTPAMNAIYPVSTLGEFMRALEHERKIELCGEQVRWPDLIRWGRIDAFMQEIKPSLPVLDQAALVYEPGKHHLWPIPQAEIDRNTNIEQGDQNPGY
ncbi:MAG TPA: RagB/SusD family nutrient uptake outer membrane protein [Bacteroidales bacterium]|nr:RagB/SusD family nutrient uptake outer membrane protein [Bacteroidales bacterium]